MKIVACLTVAQIPLKQQAAEKEKPPAWGLLGAGLAGKGSIICKIGFGQTQPGAYRVLYIVSFHPGGRVRMMEPQSVRARKDLGDHLIQLSIMPWTISEVQDKGKMNTILRR